MLYILALIIDGSEVGLPLGFYTSQWLSNFMLQPLDHFIKEQLKAVHYIRYMDDMVVFGKNKKELHRMQQEIERFLREKFNLTLMQEVVASNTTGIVESVTQFQKDAVIDEYTQQLIEEGLI